MTIVKINRTLFKAVTAIVLFLSLCLNIYSCSHIRQLSSKYKSLLYLTNQLNDASVVAFVASPDSTVNNGKNIEIFDIAKGKVILKAKADSSMQAEAISYLKGITGIYTKVKAFPEKGFIIRIPLTPPATVQNQWLNNYNIKSLDEVFVLIPEDEKPYLLVLDEESRPFFYNFDISTYKLLKYLNFEIKTAQ